MTNQPFYGIIVSLALFALCLLLANLLSMSFGFVPSCQ